MKKVFYVVLLAICTVGLASGQIKRERSANVQHLVEPFWANSVVVLPSVTPLPKSNLAFTIQHAFGPVSDGFKELYGLDRSSNIRFGLDYGITDAVSVGIGRSRFDKVYDVRAKATLKHWMSGAKSTVVSVFGTLGIDSQDNNFDFSDRLSTFSSVLIAHMPTEELTVQVSPAWTHFNHINENAVFGGGIEKEAPDILSLGLAARYIVAPRVSVMMEYIPVVGKRSDGTSDTFSMGVNLETGGHVFQLFLTSTQWITPQYVVSRSRDSFWDGDFGFGFNIHRAF